MKSTESLSFRKVRKFVVISILLTAFHLISIPPMVRAQVVTDGTMGPAQSLSGPDYRIGDDLGTRAGNNLFHSFERFGIASHESAVFTGPDDIANVISRVTGGEVSGIDGLLRSEVGQANFYFINPAGVVFGENARVDVPAAFHVSTADEIRFPDGKVFSASDPGRSTLSMNPPQSFGFLSPQPASMTVNGSLLEFKPGSTVSLSGGNLTVTGSGENEAGLVAEGGEIRLTAVGGGTEEVPIGDEMAADANGSLVMENAVVSTSGDGGGTIRLSAGTMSLDIAALNADNTGARDSDGGVQIRAGNLTLRGTGSGATTDVYGSGNAGTVEVTVAGMLGLLNGAQISSSTFAKGDAGSVKINAGEIRIEGQNSEFAGIVSDAGSDSEGKGGTLEVTVAGLMELTRGAVISTSTYAKGDAGNVKIDAGQIRIDGQNSDQFTGIVSSAWSDSEGRGGTVEVKAEGMLELSNGAQISTSTYAKGDAGNVKIDAGQIRIDGQNSEFAGIVSDAGSDSEGKGGTVEVRAEGMLELIHGAVISGSTYAKGDAGNVKIDAGQIRIEGQNSDQFTGIVSSAWSDSKGNAGEINITTGKLTVENVGSITTFSANANGGPITISGKNLVLDLRNSQILTTAYGATAGNGGNININGDSLIMEGGFIQATREFRGGKDGDINIKAAIIAENDQLQIGGVRRDFDPDRPINVIQAADPGMENVTPQLDISSSLANVGTNFTVPAELATDPCLIGGVEGGGSLVLYGRGGVPAGPGEASDVFFEGYRLERLFGTYSGKANQERKTEESEKP